MYVCNQMRHLIEKKDTTMQHPISVERRVALTLYYLASDSDFHTIGHLFGLSKSTVCVVVKAVCFAIVLVLLP